MAPTTEHNARMLPMLKSIAPIRIIVVIPKAKMAFTETWRMRFVRFRGVLKLSDKKEKTVKTKTRVKSGIHRDQDVLNDVMRVKSFP
jgi:hypothetical protein